MDLNLDIQPKAQSASPIRDATTESFERDVLQQSANTPVIVDFWAPWCGPCRQLMPMLEKAVANANGAVQMVKVNIDQNPELAQIFRVQSVPMVYAFFGGQPVDGFMGAKPESELAAFVAKLAALAGPKKPEGAGDPEAAKKLLAEGDALMRDSKFELAMEKYALASEADPENAGALGSIGWCLLATGDMESVREMAAHFDDTQKKDARVRGLLFIIDTAAYADNLPEAAALEKTLAGAPKNHQARYDLALRRIAAGDLSGAIDTIIELTRMDREWQEQKARKLLLDMFEAMGPHHPLTVQGRRKLSAVLFS